MKQITKDNIIYFNVGDFKKPAACNDIYENRENFYEQIYEKDEPEVAVIVLGYNRVNKTKQCVESILKFTTDVDYKLILIDNDSEDDTFEYFKSVPYDNKLIIKMSVNTGSAFINQVYSSIYTCKYSCFVTNDVIVSHNWLSNMLECMKSDKKIGYVVPYSTNVSNLQQVDFKFNDIQQFHELTRKTNVSNPLLWEERLRVINVVSLIRKDILDLVGFGDVGFMHDFGDDDYSTRIRRAGFKLMVCGDVVVHHNHDFRNLEDKNVNDFNKSLGIGRKNFSQKFNGIDAWDDLSNYEVNMINLLKSPDKDNIRVLGIDTRCGMPLLSVKNHMRKQNIINTQLNAFTQDAKYYEDLLSVCDKNNIICDKIDSISNYFSYNSMDYILLNTPVNFYSEPIKLIEKLLATLKTGGQLLLKLKNVFNFEMFLQMIGYERPDVDADMPIVLKIQSLTNCLKYMGYTNVNIVCESFNMDNDSYSNLYSIYKNSYMNDDIDTAMSQLLVKDYLISVIK